MTGVFNFVPGYAWCTPLSDRSSCMLVTHGPSQQSCKEKYKPWKRGTTARYYTSHTKITLPTWKPCQTPAGNRTTLRSPDHRKETQSAVVWTRLILRGTVKRGRRQGRRKEGWEVNIREGKGLEFAKSYRGVENREKWRKLVVKSSRLRDRWRWKLMQRLFPKQFSPFPYDVGSIVGIRKPQVRYV